MSPRERTAASAATPLTEVGALVGDLMGLVHRRSAGGTLALMNEAGLTMAQMVALYVLDYTGAQSVTAIASFLNLSPAATSHLVDRLVGAGFVGRTEDQTDRRQKRVAIRPAGRTLAARVHQERAREFASALSLVTPELQRQFARILGRVVEQLRGAREDCAEPERLTTRWMRQNVQAAARTTPAPKRRSKREVE